MRCAVTGTSSSCSHIRGCATSTRSSTRSGRPVWTSGCRSTASPSDLPPALDLSAYRIVQEGLTNTLKHGNARHADVEVRYDPGQLAIEVRDDGRGSRPVRRAGARPGRYR